ncbi:hypothetical protein Mco01_64950 [Microbispora corallina]|uniref:Uncharacterized protein n=2 Tax=Microbispora corallina TaxID=83302 RepID=A0ABQ4G8V9_9ACTN|nr:hypothetical protein Mco01_64950 [Microbispora corallina]
MDLGPVALYPVRPAPIRTESDVTNEHVEPAIDQSIAPGAGSELIIANIITELTKTLGASNALMANPNLETMRSYKYRNVILLDDYSGTGRSVLSYLDRWMSNRTIRSWHSYGWLKFNLVTYAWSPRAARALHGHPLLKDVPHAVAYGFDFDSAPWSEKERARVRKLCIDYAINKNMALGYKRSEGTLAMVHTVPNNLPHILFNGKRWDGKRWQGFFPSGYRRLSPEQQTEIAGYEPLPPNFEVLASTVGGARLAQGKIADLPRMQPLTLVMLALRDGVRNADRLYQQLALSSFEVTRLLQVALRLGFIDEQLHLTDRGHAELRHAQTRPRRVNLELQGSDEPYYPGSLRGVSGI